MGKLYYRDSYITLNLEKLKNDIKEIFNSNNILIAVKNARVKGNKNVMQLDIIEKNEDGLKSFKFMTFRFEIKSNNESSKYEFCDSRQVIIDILHFSNLGFDYFKFERVYQAVSRAQIFVNVLKM